MTAIGEKDVGYTAWVMPVIVSNYGRLRALAFDCTAVNGCSARRTLAKPINGGANTKCLLQLDIPRPSVNVQQHAAIAHFALNMVLGQGALCCYLMAIELQRS